MDHFSIAIVDHFSIDIYITKKEGIGTPKSIDDYDISENVLDGLKLEIHEGV